MEKKKDSKKQKTFLVWILLGFPWLLTFFLGFLLSFRCSASFLCGMLLCAINLGLIYWTWFYLLRRKKLALWIGFLVLKYGLVFLSLYWLLGWIHLICFSGGFVLQGGVMMIWFLLSKKR